MENRETHVCRMHSALYGLKQEPLALYSRVNNYLWEMGFHRSEDDHKLYFWVGEVPLILFLYVDDIFFIGNKSLIGCYKSKLVVLFEMKYLGLMHYFLGLEVLQRDACFFIGKGKYVVEILNRFRIEECKHMSIPLVSTG